MLPGDDFLIGAAGGLLWRAAPAGRELLLVHRSRYDDWALPKGKLKPGETWAAAALREVREETGYTAQLGAFAGVVSYLHKSRPKVVLFWNMTVADERRGPLDAGEVAEAVWLPAPRALKRLAYADERRLVRDNLRAPLA